MLTVSDELIIEVYDAILKAANHKGGMKQASATFGGQTYQAGWYMGAEKITPNGAPQEVHYLARLDYRSHHHVWFVRFYFTSPLEKRLQGDPEVFEKDLVLLKMFIP